MYEHIENERFVMGIWCAKRFNLSTQMLDKYVIPSVINDDGTLRLYNVIQAYVLYTYDWNAMEY